jgi:hypothetical protein
MLFLLRTRVLHAAAGIVALGGLLGCPPEIGDKCRVSTDCSTRGDRLCDTSQPGGYCTQLNCRGNACSDEAACVLFNSAVPGCGYDDRAGPFGSRVARAFCMAQCESDGDCRPNYACVDPRTYPWNAVILDDNQSKRACLAIPLEGQDGGTAVAASPAPVCGPAAPPLSPIDAGAARVYGPQPSVVAPAADGGADAGPRDAAVDGG